MYGIGATKAGTSWLYRYLAAHPECSMSDPKELHFFNAREFGLQSWQRNMLQKRIELCEQKAATAKNDQQSAEMIAQRDRYARWLSVLEQGNTGDYLAYLNENAGSARLVGDITPAYALLSGAFFSQMAALAPVTRFVYLLRDPVDRLWSNIRMAAARRSEETAGVAPIANRIAAKIISGEDHPALKRSDYRGTLARLSESVDIESVFIGFYETLFSAETLRKLCGFLGISYRNGNFQHRVHKGVAADLDTELKTGLARLLAPQYAAVEARFGTLPETWQHNMVKV